MNGRKMVITGLAFLCLATGALGISFTWTGGGGGDYSWDLCDNWDSCSPAPGRYPNTTADDANFTGGTFLVRFIDQLLIIDDISFSGGADITLFADEFAAVPRIYVDTLTIQGSSAPGGGDTIVHANFGAYIQTGSS